METILDIERTISEYKYSAHSCSWSFDIFVRYCYYRSCFSYNEIICHITRDIIIQKREENGQRIVLNSIMPI